MIPAAQSNVLGVVPVEDLLEQLERFMESPACALVLECFEYERASTLNSLMDERSLETPEIHRRVGFAAACRDAARMFANVRGELERRARTNVEAAQRMQTAQRQR